MTNPHADRAYEESAFTRPLSPISPFVILGIVQFADLFVILLSSYAAFAFYIIEIVGGPLNYERYGVVSLLVAVLFLGAMRVAQAYEEKQFARRNMLYVFPIIVWSATFATLLIAGFLLKVSDEYSRGWTVLWFILAIFGLSLIRFVLHNLVQAWARQGRLSRSVALVGAGGIADKLVDKFKSNINAQVHFAGLFSDNPSLPTGPATNITGTVDDLIYFARQNRVDEIIITLPLSSSREIGAIVKKLNSLPCDIRLSIGTALSEFPIIGVSSTGGAPMIEISDRPLKHWSGATKWIQDKVGASTFLIVAFPLMLVIALLIVLDSRGPIFFLQQRGGFNNNIFQVFKFRTMHANMTDPSCARSTGRNDARVTRVGRVLRRLSLDELPQLWNVLRGDMSLIGPRPHAIGMKAGRLPYDSLDDYLVRHRVRPGMTGWAQVNGLRGEIDSIQKARERIALDLYYIDNWSIWLDTKMFFMTAKIVLFDDNAY